MTASGITAARAGSDALRETAGELLRGPSPDAWLDAALADLPTLLLDHAECEKKAAGSALSLIYRYGDRSAICTAAARFVREELRHFEMVARLLRVRGIAYRRLAPARYAGALRSVVRNSEPARLVDTLLVAAFIEARSCERFGRLAQRLSDLGRDPELAAFYAGLLASEARHSAAYLAMARQTDVSNELAQRIATIGDVEWCLVNSPSTALRFHSGVPSSAQS